MGRLFRVGEAVGVERHHGLTLRDINEVPELGLGFNDSVGLLGLEAEPNE